MDKDEFRGELSRVGNLSQGYVYEPMVARPMGLIIPNVQRREEPWAVLKYYQMYQAKGVPLHTDLIKQGSQFVLG